MKEKEGRKKKKKNYIITKCLHIRLRQTLTIRKGFNPFIQLWMTSLQLIRHLSPFFFSFFLSTLRPLTNKTNQTKRNNQKSLVRPQPPTNYQNQCIIVSFPSDNTDRHSHYPYSEIGFIFFWNP